MSTKTDDSTFSLRVHSRIDRVESDTAIRDASVDVAPRFSRSRSAHPLFRPTELRRVAAAATLNIAGIIAVVLLLLPIVGYNSTAQALPKSMIDGAVLAMLVGPRGRWRTVGLFGVVVGLFLAFVMPAIPPLAAIYAIAGGAAMGVGVLVNRLSRRLAIAVAAATFAILAGAGIAIQVYFASHDRNEPFLWSLVGLELALRMVGAPIGAILGWTWLKRLSAEPRPSHAPRPVVLKRHRRVRESVSPGYTLVVLASAMVACTVPMFVHNVWLLGGIALGYAVLAIAVNQAKSVISVAIVMLWGWLFYGTASFLWHHDWVRSADFGRTLVLRFFPMATIALVMIQTVRPVAVVRLLRKARVSGAILLPLAMVLRMVPNARRDIVAGISIMKHAGDWQGRLTPIRHPIRVSRSVLGPLLRRWGTMLAE